MPSIGAESPLPQKVRVYKNHSLNSPAWDDFKPRADDVIITTALKAGTTWMQTIVGNLIFQDQEVPASLWQLTPWLDSRAGSVAKKLNLLEKQKHRRFLKTHLPQPTTILAGHAHRFVSLFGVATLIKAQGSSWTNQLHSVLTDLDRQAGIIPGRVRRKMRQGLFVDIRDFSCHLAHIPFALKQQLSLQIFKRLARIISGFGLKKGCILSRSKF